jgi:hypothetical protein
VTALVLECNPGLTTTPVFTLDDDMLGTILRFTIRPNNSCILPCNIPKTATVFVLDKKQLVIYIMRQLFLCGLIIRGGLILKPRLVVPGSNESLSIFSCLLAVRWVCQRRNLVTFSTTDQLAPAPRCAATLEWFCSACTEPFIRRLPSIVFKYHPAKWDGLL